MNTTLITIPIFMAIIVGFATQLETVATDTSDKALAFADDMNGAMDCATRGVPISQCSPELMGGYDFTPEQEAFTGILDDMQETLSNVTIIDENNETVIVI